jgi:hypothetical protein
VAYAIQHHRAGTVTASGLDVLAGVWLIISPFCMAARTSAITSNNVILGIIIAILAFIRFSNASYRTVGLSWVNALLGIWVLISPWALRFSHIHGAMTNNVCMGIIIIFLSCWSALASVNDRDQNRTGGDVSV